MTTEYQTAANPLIKPELNTVIVNSPVLRDGITISLPENVVNRIRERLPNSDFATVDQYATAVLESVLDELDKLPKSSVEDAKEDNGVGGDEVFSEEDQNGIEERLRGLGYM